MIHSNIIWALWSFSIIISVCCECNWKNKKTKTKEEEAANENCNAPPLSFLCVCVWRCVILIIITIKKKKREKKRNDRFSIVAPSIYIVTAITLNYEAENAVCIEGELLWLLKVTPISPSEEVLSLARTCTAQKRKAAPGRYYIDNRAPIPSLYILFDLWACVQ